MPAFKGKARKTLSAQVDLESRQHFSERHTRDGVCNNCDGVNGHRRWCPGWHGKDAENRTRSDHPVG